MFNPFWGCGNNRFEPLRSWDYQERCAHKHTTLYNLRLYIHTHRILYSILQASLTTSVTQLINPGHQFPFHLFHMVFHRFSQVLDSQSLLQELFPGSGWPSIFRRVLGLRLCLEEEGSNWSRRHSKVATWAGRIAGGSGTELLGFNGYHRIS